MGTERAEDIRAEDERAEQQADQRAEGERGGTDRERRDRLLIKHAVGGRTFADSANGGAAFEIESTPSGGWSFRVELDEETAAAVVKWRNELNLFVFREYVRPVVKTWYYVVPDSVVYDADTGRLRIEASSKLEYVPDVYTW